MSSFLRSSCLTSALADLEMLFSQRIDVVFDLIAFALDGQLRRFQESVCHAAHCGSDDNRLRCQMRLHDRNDFLQPLECRPRMFRQISS